MTIDLNTANVRRTVSTIDTIAPVVGRYGLVVVIAWIGALKFTAYEAAGHPASGGQQSVHELALRDLPREHVLGDARRS